MRKKKIITVQITGDETAVRRFTTAGPTVLRRNVGTTVRRLGLSLERKVKLEKLAGQVLNRRTGSLVRSVNTRFSAFSDATRFESATGTALLHGRAWELGFQVPGYTIHARRAKALYWLGAAHPVRSVNIPPRTEAARPFLRPALEEMRPTIRRDLALALRGL